VVTPPANLPCPWLAAKNCANTKMKNGTDAISFADEHKILRQYRNPRRASTENGSDAETN